MKKSLFLSHKDLLSLGGGGNQICSREYRDALIAAGFELEFVTHGTDQKAVTRLHRKLFPERYPKLISGEFLLQVKEACRKHRPDFVFCNFTNYLPLAAQLRAILPAQVILVLLSHGLSSVDDVHRDRIAREPFAKNHLRRLGPKIIGKAILTEMKGLPVFDHVFCLAEFEVPICRWLGARSVSWWPRTIPHGCELDWKPEGGRIGLVGTLDHPPNLEGVFLFCEALAKHKGTVPRLRLVTRSNAVAKDLRKRYEFVDDLGSLEDPGKMEAEAATWSAYIHPIFCLAMGCSTKLATGIAWGLPIISTEAGIRGYSWAEGNLLMAADANEMARLAIKIQDRKTAEAAKTETMKVQSTAPTLTAVSQLFREKLLGPLNPK
ncbi:glycosyltransferase [bacterium]|nr:glycosyltransferase [bacterium]